MKWLISGRTLLAASICVSTLTKESLWPITTVSGHLVLDWQMDKKVENRHTNDSSLCESLAMGRMFIQKILVVCTPVSVCSGVHNGWDQTTGSSVECPHADSGQGRDTPSCKGILGRADRQTNRCSQTYYLPVIWRIMSMRLKSVKENSFMGNVAIIVLPLPSLSLHFPLVIW